MSDLAEHQKAKILELEERSESEVAVAIQQCYQHVFYPSRNRLPRAEVDLAHTALALHNTSDSPGAGQVQILRTLREQKKLRTREDEPDAPAYIRDRTPLRKGQMTTLALRDEFRKDPALPILLGDDVFVTRDSQGRRGQRLRLSKRRAALWSGRSQRRHSHRREFRRLHDGLCASA